MTDFLNTYEQLSSLNEDAKSDAGKRFWAAAKNNQIDEDSFCEAYEEELKQLGLDGIFWPHKREDGTISLGKLKHRGVYGDIKKAKEANPNSYAIKACAKLWALQFVEGAKYNFEIREREEQQRRADELKRKEEEKKRLEQEKIEQQVQAYRDILPDALAAINSELTQEYLDTYKITKDDIDVSSYKAWNDEDKIIVLPSEVYMFSLTPKDGNILNWLIHMLNSEFEDGIKKAKKREEQEKAKSNNVIDVISANNNSDKRTVCTAVLEGDSGALYYLGVNGGRINISDDLGTDVTDINYLLQITEPYKVIYTSVDSDSTFGGRGSSTEYYSWDSSKEALLKPIIPKEGSYSDISMDSETKRVSSGDGKNLSLMDNIDSWMIKDCRHWSLD